MSENKNWLKLASLVGVRPDFDALLVTSPVNRFYATGFHSSDGMVVITRDKGYLLTDFRYIEAAEKTCPDLTVRMVPRGVSYMSMVKDILEEAGVSALGYEEGATVVRDYQTFAEKLPVRLVPASDLFIACRAVKEEWELNRIRKAQSITERSLEGILPFIKEGISERALYAELIHLLYKNGASALSFDPIVVSGANSSLPHGVAGQKLVEKGDFVTLDFGASYDGYCSDMTRTVAVGHATDEMKRVYDVVLRAQRIGLEKARAGVQWADVDGAARAFIASEGYGDYFGHGLGHGLGVEVHEAIAPAGELTRAGSMATVEPGIYLPGKFGVRIEDMVVLREGGNEDLTSAPKELLIL